MKKIFLLLSAAIALVACNGEAPNTLDAPNAPDTEQTTPDAPVDPEAPVADENGIALAKSPKELSLDGAVKKAEELAAELGGNAFIPQQFVNPNNPDIHYRTTAVELFEQMAGDIDIFVSGLGSGGTLQGIGKFLKEKNPNVKIVAVEPKDVSALLGHEPGLHQIQGIGDGFIPEVLDTELIDEVVEVSDADAIYTTRKMAEVYGLLCGTSSGANVWAAIQMANKYGKEKRVATILADRIERYFSTNLL